MGKMEKVPKKDEGNEKEVEIVRGRWGNSESIDELKGGPKIEAGHFGSGGYTVVRKRGEEQSGVPIGRGFTDTDNAPMEKHARSMSHQHAAGDYDSRKVFRQKKNAKAGNAKDVTLRKHRIKK
jgi:hypothetical protein